MPRKKPLKAPFVVTISIAAAASFAVACGGKAVALDEAPGRTNPVPAATCTGTTRVGDPCNAGESSCGVEGPAPTYLDCRNGQWQTSGTYNPPSPPCPPSEPRTGEACSPSFGGKACTYLDRCVDRPNGSPTDRRYWCTDHVWTRQDAYRVSCPAKVPSSGDSCASCADGYPAECKYFETPDCPPVLAACDAQSNTWKVALSSCNPPPVDAGGP